MPLATETAMGALSNFAHIAQGISLNMKVETAFNYGVRCEGEFMLWTIFVILVILWILGFSFHIGGGLIHILLVIALCVLVYNLVIGRRS